MAGVRVVVGLAFIASLARQSEQTSMAVKGGAVC